MKYLMGIDIGTTGAKCGLLDINGNLISSGYREYACTYPKPNWVEQDVDEIIEKALDATKEAVAKENINTGDIISIAASTQRTCSIFVDAQGKALKMISWQDNRTTDEVEEIHRVMGDDTYYDITGLPLNTTWILTKIMWMKKNEPELWAKTKRIVQLQDYFLKHLGADEYYVDMPDAVLFGLWDNDKFTWSQEILEKFSIDKSLLPKPTKCGTLVGKLGKEVAGMTGLKEGTPICVGAGDQNAAAIGAGIIEEGIASVSIGTGGMAIVMLNERYRDPEMRACMGNHAIYGKWQFEGYQIGAAGVLRWFRDNIADLEKEHAISNGKDVYIRINEMIEETEPGAKGLLFMPYLASSAAPRWNPDARGTMLGLTFAHDKRHLARAFMEGITLEQKDILTNMRNCGSKIDKVRIMGGATKSELWCQMQADMYEAEVETLKMTDAALVGACILAGVGIGQFSDIKEGVKRMVIPDKIYKPNNETVKVYNKLYELYEKVYKAMDDSGVYTLISQFQK